MRYLRLMAAAAVAVAVGATAIWNFGDRKAQERPWGESYIPNSTVMTQRGKPVKFYDDLIKGKIVIISFIYTSCTDICPLTTARVAQLEEKLGDMVGREVFFLSMTVDPEHDTPERLKEYAERFGAGPGWSFVTGKPADIRAINYKFGDRSGVISEHRNEIVMGNDTTGEWQKDSVFGDIDRLALTVRSLDPKWHDQVRPPQNIEGLTGTAMSSQPGQALFKKMCAPCHTIGVGDRVGPDLRGVTARRDQPWLEEFIQNPSKMRAKNDPTALALAAEYPAVRMPAVGLAPADAADLISYLTTETARLEEDKGPVIPAAAHADHQHHHH
jgi:cytochrome oxidase Cu insertion factor (SCO1/SenC/PrrC family)/cytochrome c2